MRMYKRCRISSRPDRVLAHFYDEIETIDISKPIDNMNMYLTVALSSVSITPTTVKESVLKKKNYLNRLIPIAPYLNLHRIRYPLLSTRDENSRSKSKPKININAFAPFPKLTFDIPSFYNQETKTIDSNLDFQNTTTSPLCDFIHHASSPTHRVLCKHSNTM